MRASTLFGIVPLLSQTTLAAPFQKPTFLVALDTTPEELDGATPAGGPLAGGDQTPGIDSVVATGEAAKGTSFKAIRGGPLAAGDAFDSGRTGVAPAAKGTSFKAIRSERANQTPAFDTVDGIGGHFSGEKRWLGANSHKDKDIGPKVDTLGTSWDDRRRQDRGGQEDGWGSDWNDGFARGHRRNDKRSDGESFSGADTQDAVERRDDKNVASGGSVDPDFWNGSF
jgi:hypothetical protein